MMPPPRCVKICLFFEIFVLGLINFRIALALLRNSKDAFGGKLARLAFLMREQSWRMNASLEELMAAT